MARIQRDGATLTITVADVLPSASWEFHITITPNPKKPWTLPVRTVYLRGSTLNRECYVGSWKVFETWLLQTGLKDDLVQLNEYYAYTPILACKFIANSRCASEPLWLAVNAVVAGIGIRKVKPAQQLARELGVSRDQLHTVLLGLRDLGYEVRNHSTNPQIPRGSYLIPYSFPTFSQRSVQLRKAFTDV
jgi:DNA (cytosine-5)-methyltransferase 1